MDLIWVTIEDGKFLVKAPGRGRSIRSKDPAKLYAWLSILCPEALDWGFMTSSVVNHPHEEGMTHEDVDALLEPNKETVERFLAYGAEYTQLKDMVGEKAAKDIMIRRLETK